MSDMSTPYHIDVTGRDVQGEAALLREQAPATLIELPGGVRAWAVVRQQAIRTLLTDPRVSRDPYRHWPAWENGEGELAKTWPLAVWVQDRNMITAYGAEHSRLRKLVSRAFTPRRVDALGPDIRATTDTLLAKLASVGPDTTVDLRAEFCYPLPVQVISDLLGIPQDMRGRFLGMMNAIFATALSEEEATANLTALYALAHQFIELRRSAPGEDLASALIVAKDEGGTGLTEEELIDTIFLMYTAGHETTVNLIDQAVFALLTHPEQFGLVRDGAATWDDVIEETLRYQSPIASMPLRFAVEDIDLEGVSIGKGDPILIYFGGAGRDPRVHGESASRFDVTRATRGEHLAFGHGVHYCVGAPLARMEARIALPALFTRFPGLRLAADAEQIEPVESFVSNGHRDLPVRLGPESTAG
jgi:cytochrome P450